MYFSIMDKIKLKNYIKIIVPRRDGNNAFYLTFSFNFFTVIIFQLYF